ncbi:MAG: hypothetical protein KDC87_10285 [Planctomycetes bacterium]|nr:hypothetical protein [Planctomycetota bacterium]
MLSKAAPRVSICVAWSGRSAAIEVSRRLGRVRIPLGLRLPCHTFPASAASRLVALLAPKGVAVWSGVRQRAR